MLGRITLIRHGRSAHVQTGWITSEGFRAWRIAYEAAGLSEGEAAPAALAARVGADAIVVASDAARAVASARLLAPGREITLSPLLRELDLEGPALGAVRMPLLGWAFAVGGRSWWLRRRGRHPRPAEATRIDEATRWLATLAERHADVIVVTHASFRRELAARLTTAGWSPSPGSRSRWPSRWPSWRHWSAWELTRE